MREEKLVSDLMTRRSLLTVPGAFTLSALALPHKAWAGGPASPSRWHVVSHTILNFCRR